MQGSRRLFSIFSLVFLLLGLTGINVTGAATKAKLTAPSAPYSPKAPGGTPAQAIVWMAPKSNGGSPITSYTVTYYPGKKSKVCNGSKLTCVITVANPNKPSSKPSVGIFYFTVIATNSIGSSPESERSPKILVNFPATIFITPKSGSATPTPIPTFTPSSTPTPAYSDSTHPFVTNAFDGTYTGTFVTYTTVGTGLRTGSTNSTSFVIYAGRGTGRAANWSIDGYITDAAGVATITTADATYGSYSFNVTFTQDPVTKGISGSGKGTHTFNVGGYGSILVEFFFNVSKAAS